MDTSILTRLFEIAPDLMQEVELRTLILERVAALGPIGRRALAQRLHLNEREVRSAADALRQAGCIVQNSAGMELTERGRSLLDTARTVSRGRRSVASMELTLSRRLGVERVCVVHGDADVEEAVLDEAAQEAARQIRFLLQDARVLAVSGGQAMALTARSIAAAAPMDLTVVPAQGGMGVRMQLQANTVAELFAEQLGVECRMLHMPEGITQALVEELSRLPQVREAIELLRHADVAFYGVSDLSDGAALRHGIGATQSGALRHSGAVAEAMGMLFNRAGEIVDVLSPGLMEEGALGHAAKAALIAAGSRKAEAILAVCAHHPHKLLVTDEGAAKRMLELMRV